jgi:hypothetical protein
MREGGIADYRDCGMLQSRAQRMMKWLQSDETRLTDSSRRFSSSDHARVFRCDSAYLVTPLKPDRDTRFFLYYPGGRNEELYVDYFLTYLDNPEPNTVAVFLRRNGVDDIEAKNTEAIELLQPHNDEFEYPVSWGCDLQTEHERFLTEQIFQRPVFVTDYPKEIKSFYMKLNPDGKTVAAMDCLVPGIGEIIGGSQREDDYEKLLARIEELGMKRELYDFYLDLRKYGSARHAGFGLGFERCVMYLTGMGNIRDVLPFPRTVGTCEL